MYSDVHRNAHKFISGLVPVYHQGTVLIRPPPAMPAGTASDDIMRLSCVGEKLFVSITYPNYT
jgi:hypothetical protein